MDDLQSARIRVLPRSAPQSTIPSSVVYSRVCYCFDGTLGAHIVQVIAQQQYPSLYLTSASYRTENTYRRYIYTRSIFSQPQYPATYRAPACSTVHVPPSTRTGCSDTFVSARVDTSYPPSSFETSHYYCDREHHRVGGIRLVGEEGLVAAHSRDVLVDPFGRPAHAYANVFALARLGGFLCQLQRCRRREANAQPFPGETIVPHLPGPGRPS